MTVVQKIRPHALPGLLFVGMLWLIHAAAYAMGADLGSLGILPRTWIGLSRIFTYPLIHSDWMHLLNNSFPLLFLSTVVHYFYQKKYTTIFITIYLGSGLGIWAIGASAWHIGASGVVYGLAFFLFVAGVISRQRQAMAVSLVIVFLYGSIVWGLLPIEAQMSWEGHLSGAVVGALLAVWLVPRPEELVQPAEQKPPLWDYSHTADRAVRFDYKADQTPDRETQ